MEKDKRVKWLLDNLPERRVTNEISKEIEGYLDEIEKLRRELSDTEDYLNNLRIEEINIEIMADFLRRFVEYFEKMETGQRRLLIQAIVKEAIVYGHEDIRLRLALPIFKDGDIPPNGNGNGGDRGFSPNGGIPPQICFKLPFLS